jgi:16S rRNA (adenine1518-N6/adenine1519-N6)-dimethyltransferase
MNLGEILSILRERKLAPNPKYGQNFLHDENLARWIVKSSGVKPGSRVLEIGPGLGALTEFFLESGAEVVAIEIDNGLADYLEERFAGQKIKIIRGDAIKMLKIAAKGADIICGNLPYNIAVPLIIQITIFAQHTIKNVWMVQKEISKRISALPSTLEYGSVSVVVQTFCKILQTHPVGTKVFYPEPSVQSSVIITEPLSQIHDFLCNIPQREAFCAFVRSAFSNRRKMLFKMLRKNIGWNDSILKIVNITGRERPEQIDPQTWQEIFCNLQKITSTRD